MLKVYGAQWCLYCKKAKEFLETNHIEFEFIDIDIEIDQSTILIDKGLTTIPQIFDEERLVGGYDSLVKLYDK